MNASAHPVPATDRISRSAARGRAGAGKGESSVDEKDWLILKILREKKSITKTAAAVYISQPALSKRLQQLEERFGTAIAVRGKNGIELTPAGEYLAQCSCEFLDRLQSMQERLDDMGDTIQGTIRIGASYFCTKYILPDILMRFKECYPLVEFELNSAWSSHIGKLVHDRSIHVGFIRNDYTVAEEKYLLFRERTYVCAKKEYSLADLPDAPQISYKSDVLIRADLMAWWNQRYSKPPRVIMEVDTVGTSADMVERGLGYAFLSEILAGKIKDTWKHEMLHADGTPYYRHAWLITNQDAKQLKLIDRFIHFAQEYDFTQI